MTMILGRKAAIVLAVVAALAIGASGYVLASMVGHLFQDHTNLHVLITIEQQRIQQQQRLTLPQPPGPDGGGS